MNTHRISYCSSDEYCPNALYTLVYTHTMYHSVRLVRILSSSAWYDIMVAAHYIIKLTYCHRLSLISCLLTAYTNNSQ